MIKPEKADALEESQAAAPPSRWLRVDKALAYAGVSRTFFYRLLNSRKVASHMIGRVRLVDRESLDAFISSAPVGDFDSGTKIAKRKKNDRADTAPKVSKLCTMLTGGLSSSVGLAGPERFRPDV